MIDFTNSFFLFTDSITQSELIPSTLDAWEAVLSPIIVIIEFSQFPGRERNRTGIQKWEEKSRNHCTKRATDLTT